MRIGFVLGRDGGALPRLARLARLHLGGTVGDGRQYVSWIHERDFRRLVLWCVERPEAAGVYNATGPCPVTNAEFMCELRCALRRPWSPRLPAWLVRLGAFLMRTEPGLALEGRRCIPERLVEENFKFLYTNLESALADLTGPRPAAWSEAEPGAAPAAFVAYEPAPHAAPEPRAAAAGPKQRVRRAAVAAGGGGV